MRERYGKIDDEARTDAELMIRTVANIPYVNVESGNVIIKNVSLIYYTDVKEYTSYWSRRDFPDGYNRRVIVDLPMIIEGEFMRLERIAYETRAKKVTRIDFTEGYNPQYKEKDISNSLTLHKSYLDIFADYEGLSAIARLSLHFEGFGLKDAPAKMVRRFADKYGGRGRTTKV